MNPSVMLARVARLGDRGLERVPRWAWNLCLPAIYMLIVLPQLHSHSFWFDEAQAWLIAKESKSLPELIQHLRFEGHPPLWYLILWPFAHVFNSPEWMKVPNGLLTGSVAFMLPRLRSLTRVEHLLIFGGFTMLVGYSTISRSYILGVALTVLYLLVRMEGRSLTTEMLVVTLLVITHLLFALIAGAFFISSIDSRRGSGTSERTRWTWHERSATVAASVTAGFVAWLVWNPNAVGLHLLSHLNVSAISRYPVAAAFLPVSYATMPHLLDDGPAVWVLLLAVVSVLLLSLAGALAIDRRSAPMAWAACALLLNSSLGYGHEWWHMGVLPWALIAGVALSRTSREPVDVQDRGLEDLRRGAFRMLLVFPVAASTLWFASPLNTLPYSSERQAAQIVSSACSDGCEIVTDGRAATVSAYLGGTRILELESADFRTFATHDARLDDSNPATWDALRQQLESLGPRAVAFLFTLRNPPDDFIVLGRTGHSAISAGRGVTAAAPDDLIVVRLR